MPAKKARGAGYQRGLHQYEQAACEAAAGCEPAPQNCSIAVVGKVKLI